MRREQLRKFIAGKKAYSRSRSVGERVEPLQLGVDKARMAHDHAAVRQAVEKARKQRREIGVVVEVVGAGEGRIGAHAERCGAPAEAPAQDVEQKALAVGQAAPRAAPTRPHWRTQASGALSLATSSTRVAICGNRCTC